MGNKTNNGPCLYCAYNLVKKIPIKKNYKSEEDCNYLRIAIEGYLLLYDCIMGKFFFVKQLVYCLHSA